MWGQAPKALSWRLCGDNCNMAYLHDQWSELVSGLGGLVRGCYVISGRRRPSHREPSALGLRRGSLVVAPASQAVRMQAVSRRVGLMASPVSGVVVSSLRTGWPL